MKFKKMTVPPAGRNKYGNYMSSSNVTQAVVKTTYYGDSSTNGGGNKPVTPETPSQPEDSFLMFLSKTFGAFDGKAIALADVTDSISLIGYKNLTRCDTYVGNISGEASDGGFYDIVGLPESGMTVVVKDNGTPNTTIEITISSAITSMNGTLRIPCNVYRNSVSDDPLGNDISAWTSLAENCSTLWLEWGWSVQTSATEAYRLELTNELAAINCDADGNILQGAVRPTCQAILFYGADEIDDATYEISYPSTQEVAGVAINTETGELTFGSNFTFIGTALEIQVMASYKGEVVGRKIMTVAKNYPGESGEPAVNRWITTSASAIYVDYNYNPPRVMPTAVSAKVMEQVGEKAPAEATGTTLYYGYDVENPSNIYAGSVPVDVSKAYLSFGLRNEAGEYYELETIPLIEAGLNGTDGKDGQSAYRLDLSNDNASINSDSNGNVLAGAYRPKCTARLFLGTTIVEGATYSILSMSEPTDVTIDSSTGVITVGNISFANTALEITVAAYIDGVIYGQSIFTISKSIAGTNGTDGQDGKDGVDGADGVNGKDGVSIIWKGEYPSHPSNPQNGWCYKNTTDKKSYLYQDGAWYQMTVDGTDGQDGKDGTSISIAGTLTSQSQLPTPPTNPNDCYIIGQDIWIWDGSAWYNGGQFKGDNGVSIIWKGSHASHISNPEPGWAYYNTTDKRSYIYDGTEWDIMTYDGIDGKDGLSVEWKGDLVGPPSNPKLNWCYRDTDNGKVYIYNGSAWELMVVDGSDGTDGADGKDGLSVFITYHDNAPDKAPSIPTGNGTTNGWHTNATSTANWMSQKVAESATSGSWGNPIQICGLDGKDGHDGVDGTDGINGKDGVSIIWKGSLNSHPSNPQNGWAYYNTTQKKSFVYQDGAWYQMTVDGVDGANGKDGANGMSIVWKGDLATPPTNPQLNWCYRDTDNGKVYIYNGSAWELMVVDGSDGADGADGADGMSVYITYHDNAITSTPSTPTGNGTTNGWHTNATAASNWMSQKVAASASSGTWGSPIQITGADGTDGADGQDAVSYWMEFSANEVRLDKNGNPNPNSITVKGWKQVGQQTPVNITSTASIRYGYNTISPSLVGTTVSIPANTSYSYLSFAMYVDNVKVDGNETILILRDGADGSDGLNGADGRQGAALRGPVDYYKQTTSRRFCNGKLTSTSYPEDAEFIDIIVRDGETYLCNTSYTGSANDSWSNVSSRWTKVTDKYDFVATNILLAKNASIDFATTNGLYLRDSNGNITAGAEGGDSVNFWAGSNEPENGLFKVEYDGTMTATKGKFGLLEIGTDVWSDGLLKGTHIQNDGTNNTLSLQPHMLSMEAVEGGVIKSRVRIGPYADPDCYDMEGEVFVELENERDTAIATNAYINASGYRSGTLFAAFSPMNGLSITFVTDTNYFTKSGDYWYWKGMPLTNYFRTSTYPYVKLINGEWCFCYTSTATTGVGTGIYGTAHTKSNNQIYIVI